MTLAYPTSPPERRPVSILVTGGAGFVMSALIRQVLANDPAVRVVMLDLGPFDALVVGYLAGYVDRVTYVQGDVRDRGVLDSIAAAHDLTHVVHAAAVTIATAWEIERPTWYIDVNIMGTVSVLDWARHLPGLVRFLYVSSGAVYGFPTAESPREPQPETGPFNPVELYSITKYTSELICRRYGELYGMATVRVRPTSVFGPMERPTSARINISLPYRMMRACLEGRPFRVTPNTLAAGGDFISNEDAAVAMAALLSAPRLHYDAYNLASGRFIGIRELLQTFRTVAPAFRYEVVDDSRADANIDPTHRQARWNAYAIARAAEDVGWKPRSLAEQLAGYMAWVQDDPDRRCPPLA
jgi:nucleoside-diphosphate-sugar epimerase